MTRKLVQSLLGSFLVPLLLLIPSSAQANQSDSHLRCEAGAVADGGQFCATIAQLSARLLADDWARWWVEWADEHEVVIIQQERLALVPNGAIRYNGSPSFSEDTAGQIWIAPGVIKNDLGSALLLLHELTHFMDGPYCQQDPWAHERVYFWLMLAAYKLGQPTGPVTYETAYYSEKERVVWRKFWPIQRAFAQQPRDSEEPCREMGEIETAPWGVTYSQLRSLLSWR